MNKFLYLLLLPIIVYANPSWFYNITPTSKNEIIGYGVSDKLSIAKQNAMSDIVKTIYIDINTQIDISKSLKDGDYNKNVSSILQTKTKATLSGVEFIKVEEFDGIWYVSAKYDNSPIEIKLKNKLTKNLKDEHQNRYLQNTNLFNTLNNEINVKLNYKLIRKDNLWQIRYKDIMFPLKQDEFYKLFSNQKNQIISLIANKKIYKENDEMYFNINLKKRGYISILYVEHNGKVGVVLSNKLENKNFTYPDLKSEDTFKVVNPYGKTIKELYVILYSKKQIDLSEFENVSNNLLDNSNYNFDKLIKKLSNVKYSTFTIKIRK